MRSFILLFLVSFGALLVAVACVDSLDQTLKGTVNVVVVDGIITDQAEPQIIRLSQSRPDPQTGRFGLFALTKARVEVVVDSAQVIACHETTDGRYLLPSDFRGQIGHIYQLRFTLPNGTHYQSSSQVMQPVTPIEKVALRFNPTSLATKVLTEDYLAGFDVFIDTQDPPNQRNYYRWDWNLYEKQDWCQSCQQGYYMTNQLKMVSSYPDILIYQTQPQLSESCFGAPSPDLFGGNFTKPPTGFINSYVCRTQCWDIIPSSSLNVFNDEFSNGGQIRNRNIGQIPYYTQNPALVEIRQSSLTADAYRYFSLLRLQTQNMGGLVDTPPTALIGNVRNVVSEQEKVVGYFTAGAISSVRYWLTKQDATGVAYGGVYYDPADKLTKPVPSEQQLFFAFNRVLPVGEFYSNPINFTILGGAPRPPTALCVSSDTRTPIKPVGWRD